MIQIGSPIATIESPIDHLMACHRRIEQRLETLLNTAVHIDDDRAAALEAISKSLNFLDTSGALHTEDEEASLFPRLRQKLSAPEIAFIDSLEAQHAEAGSIHAELKQLAAELSIGSESSPGVTRKYHNCAKRLQLLYQVHIRAEDEILTAMARRSLDIAALAEISREMRDRRAPR